MDVGLFGTGRNGSSLLTRLLDGAPGTYVHPAELNLLTSINRLDLKCRIRKFAVERVLRRKYLPIWAKIKFKKVEPLINDQFTILLTEYLNRSESPIGLNEIQYKRNCLNRLSQSEISVCIMELFCDLFCENAERRVFKSIEVQYLDYYQKLFPEMKFIHIFRNPLDLYSSAKRTELYHCSNKYYRSILSQGILYDVIVDRWMSHVKFCGRHINDPQHLIIKYEDLIEAPTAVMTRICRFLNVAAYDKMDRLTVLGGNTPRKLPVNVSQKGIKTPLIVVKNINTANTYKEVLSDEETTIIKSLTFNEGQRIGYVMPGQEPSKREAIKSLLRLNDYEFLNNKNILDFSISLQKALLNRLSLFRLILGH